MINPDAAAAEATFAGMARTLATRWPEPDPDRAARLPGILAGDPPLPIQQILGDGDAAILARSSNATLFVRHPNRQAALTASRILAALALDGSACRGTATLPGGKRADGCGL